MREIELEKTMMKSSVPRRWALLAGLVVVGTAAAWAFGRSRAPATPEIEIEPRQHDFGHAVDGDVVTTQVTLRNTGRKTLNIVHLDTTCGCLAAFQASKENPLVIPPGQSVTRGVSLDTRGRRGPLDHRLTIFSNDPENSELSALFHADVVGLVEGRPERIELGEVGAGSTVERRVDLAISEGLDACELDRVHSTGPADSCETELREIENPADTNGGRQSRRQWELAVRVKAPRRPGQFQWSVVVHRKEDNVPVLTIPVHGYVVPEIRFSPSGLVIATCSPGAEILKTLDCSAVDEASWELELAENSDRVHVQISPGTSSRDRRVEIRWTAPAEPGLVRDKLVFNTGRESMPQFELPIYARVE